MPHAACPTPRSPITDESGWFKLTQTDYTLKRLNLDDNYHKGVVRSKLTRNVAVTFEKVHDELPGAVRDSIPTVGEGILSRTLAGTTRWLHVQCRLGQGICAADHATSELSYLESSICGSPSVCVITTIRRLSQLPTLTLNRPKP